MSTITQSLLNYLGSQNPSLNISHCPTGKNTKSRTKSVLSAWKSPRMIIPWDDFEYDALRSIYGGALHEVLGSQFTIEQVPIPREIPCCQIHDEKSFEACVILWNRSIVNKALDTAQPHLDNRLSLDNIYMCLGGQAQLPTSELHPDWAAIMPSTISTGDSDAKSKNFLPGETKLSRKWSSGKIVQREVQPSQPKSNWIQPLAQTYTYCIRVNARYGYIITDKELVVFRIRPIPSPNGDGSQLKDLQSLKDMNPRANVDRLKDMQLFDETPAKRAQTNGLLEFKAIPWANHFHRGRDHLGQLTVNLSLWWLHIMAAESSCIEERYEPLRDAVWRPQARIQRTEFTSSTSFKKRPPLARKAANRRSNTSRYDPKLRDKKRLRDDFNDGEHLNTERLGPQKRQTRGHI